MADFNVDRLYKSFYPYHGSITNIEIETDNHPLYGGHSYQSSSIFVGRQRVTLTVQFGSLEGLSAFSRDFQEMSEIREEERLRQVNPTLQKAYEEYQILLKLMK